MKIVNYLFVLLVVLIAHFSLLGQTTIWSENFEGDVSGWTLNSGGSGSNQWIINNSWSGSSSTPTPSQASTTITPVDSYYLHIHPTDFLGTILGNHAVYTNNDGFLCSTCTSDRDAISTTISTSGYTGVKLSYWWLGVGQPGIAEGKTYYSLDNGSTWTLLRIHHSQGTWQLVDTTLAVFDNQSQIKLKFNWINGATGNDPAFSIDAIRFYVDDDVPPPPPPPPGNTTINNVSINKNDVCHTYQLATQITYTATGTFTSGNQYIVEISDATGSFASPVQIGTETDGTSGTKTTDVNIPNTLAVGTGYKIRVRSTAPAALSTEVAFTVHPKPTVSLNFPSSICETGSTVDLTTYTTVNPSGGTLTYSGTGVSGTQFNPQSAGSGSYDITCVYADTNGCPNTATGTIVVDTGCCSATNPTILLGDTTLVCASTFTVPADSVDNVTGTIHWSVVGNTATFDDSLSATPTITPSDPTIIYYQLVLHDDCLTDTVVIQIVSPPVVSVVNDDICAFPKVIVATSLDSLYWSPGADAPGMDFVDSLSYVNGQMKDYYTKVYYSSGTYYAIYTTDTIGSVCKYTDSIEVVFPDLPYLKVNDDSICAGAIHLISVESNDPNAVYSWNTGFTGNPLQVTEPGVYTVTMTGMCNITLSASANISLKICETEEVPNVLSLSSQNGNQTWSVPNKGASQLECLIMNRWGDVVFEINDVNGIWRGQDKNDRILSEGVYFYLIRASYLGGIPDEVKHGAITLIH